MVETIAGIIVILAGCVQWHLTWRFFKNLKHTGNTATPAFTPMAVYSSALFGLIMLGFGIALTFRMI
jgi:hypothetical protein